MSRNQVIAAGLALLTAFAFGRFSAPSKIVETHEKTSTSVTDQEKKTNDNSDSERNKHVERTTTEVTRPDGTREVVTKVTEDTSTSRRSESSADNRSESVQASTDKSSKEITFSRDKVTIAALAGMSISFSSGFATPVYGGEIMKPILGPIAVGIWGLSSGVGGVAVGLTF